MAAAVYATKTLIKSRFFESTPTVHNGPRRIRVPVIPVLEGEISASEASHKYGFTQAEFREWAEEYHRGGVAARSARRRCGLLDPPSR